MVIEDDPATREAYMESLKALNARVLTCARCADALKRHREEHSPVDLVLADIRLPDGDGREIVARLRRAQRAPLGALYITGAEQIDHDTLEPGDRLLHKPVELARVEAAVLELLELGARSRGEQPSTTC